MNSVKSNYIWNVLYSIANVLIPLITTPYLARTLGAAAIGKNSYVAANVSYFLLFAVLGTTLYGQRQIAKVKTDKIKLSQNFLEIELFRITSTLISFVPFVFLLHLDINYKELYYLYILTFINVIFDISWFYKGIEDFKKVTLVNFSVRILHTIFIFSFIRTPDDLWLYVLSSVLCTIVGNLSLWIGLRQRFTKIEKIAPFRDIKGVILLFLPTIASQVYILLDRSMIGWINGSTYQIGCYEETDKLIRIAISVIESTSMVMLSRVAFLYKEQKRNEAIGYVYKAYRFAILLSFPMFLGLISISNRLVLFFWGAGFDYINNIIPILCFMLPITSISSVTGYSLLIPIGKQNIYTVAISCTTVVNIILNLVLIPKMEGVGAAIASVVSELVGMSIQLVCCNRYRIINVKKIFIYSWKYIVASVLMFFVLKYFGVSISGGALMLLLLIIVGIITYSVFLFIMRDDFFFSSVSAIITSINKRKINVSE